MTEEEHKNRMEHINRLAIQNTYKAWQTFLQDPDLFFLSDTERHLLEVIFTSGNWERTSQKGSENMTFGPRTIDPTKDEFGLERAALDRTNRQLSSVYFRIAPQVEPQPLSSQPDIEERVVRPEGYSGETSAAIRLTIDRSTPSLMKVTEVQFVRSLPPTHLLRRLQGRN